MKNFQTVTCLCCGWVHMGVTREYAENSVKAFCEYFDNLPKEKQDDFYNGTKPTILDYESCSACGNSWKNFREAREGDCPIGCTIGPIIHFESQ